MTDQATVSASGQQHVQMFRKLLLRRHLLRWALDGAAYVPFIGDGDVAAELYGDRYVLGADLDPERVAKAQTRFGDATIIAADCNAWPFEGAVFSADFPRSKGLDHGPATGTPPTVAVADFDAYSYPYESFRSFWAADVPKADRLVLFFTDGERQSVVRMGKLHHPDGRRLTFDDDPALVERRKHLNFYLWRYVWPWFEDFVSPWRVVYRFRYLRLWMAYWGVVIERG